MYAATPIIPAEPFARIPDSLWKSGSRMGILEGPCFDANGNLFVVHVPYGQVFRISPTGDVELVAEYDGEPNGMKLAGAGRVFIADHSRGLLDLDDSNGRVATLLGHAQPNQVKRV